MTEKQAKEVQKRLAKHNPFVRLTASNLAGNRVAFKQKLLSKLNSKGKSMFNNLGNIFKHIGFSEDGTAVCSEEKRSSALYFTQAELQQIKEVLRVRIASEENMQKVFQVTASNFKLDGDKEMAKMYYNDVEKSKKKIKALAAVQTKVKHSILTLG